MSCYFRAAGTHFDVDAFLQQTNLVPPMIWQKGEPRGLTSKVRTKHSGLSMTVSEASFQEVGQQIEDAIVFLKQHEAWLTVLAERSDVQDMIFDFSIEDRPDVAQADGFPPELLRLLGQFNVHLVISRYPYSAEETSDGPNGRIL